MASTNSNLIYSKQSLEFVTVATKYCSFVENADKLNKKDFVIKIHKLLSYLYQKAVILPNLELIYDANQKYVTELEWNLVKDKINNVLISTDEFVHVENILEYQEDIAAEYSLSELMADIYQELMDFVSVYQIGNEDSMNDALYEIKLGFEQFWGMKVIALLQAFHRIIFSDTNLSDEEKKESNNSKVDDENWVNKQWE
jgi:hypothetical protein